MNYRLESDSVGEKQVPMDAYYGVQTLRAFENFNITGRKQPAVIVESLAEIKKACDITKKKANDVPAEIADAIVAAYDDILAGLFHDQFITDPIQGGAGTSTNMNANEVIANIALEKLGKEKGDYKFCHPNDHVNMAQSTNDVYPTALKLAIYKTGLKLLAKLDELDAALTANGLEHTYIVNEGGHVWANWRTYLNTFAPLLFK